MSQDFSAQELPDLLSDLGTRLIAKGLQAEIFIVGGAALALAYDTRRVTQDLDGIFVPRDEVLAEAKLMANKRGLNENWLSEGVLDYWPTVEDDSPETVLSVPGVTVSAASPHYLFSMKVMAARGGGDRDDAVALARIIGVETEDEMVALAEYTWGGALPEKSILFIEEIERELRTGIRRTELPSVQDIFVPPYIPNAVCGAWMPRAKRHCSLPRHTYGQHR